jgi:hypothetical protein
MMTKQLGMIYRIIEASGHPELVKVLRTAMSRSRRDAVNEIHSQSTPLLKHLLPLVALKRSGMQFPVSWPVEIKEYLSNIDVANGKKNKKWLEASEIVYEINSSLSTPLIVRNVMKKMDKFQDKQKQCVKSFLDKLFSKHTVTLKDFGVSLKHEKTELGFELVLLIDGKKL